MKKLTMICMSALLMLAVSCKKDKKTEVENAGSGFRATVESHEGTGKTHLEGLAVKWDSGDAILVKSSTCTTPRGFTTTGSGATVNFDANETLPTNFYEPPYTGYYPASAFEGDQLTLPATQTYVADAATFANGANPMAATSSETLLPFKNICGVLKLQLHSETACNVNNITITSNTGEMLWGTGTVTLSGGIPTLGTLSNGGSTLTLNCNGEAMSTSSSSPSTYFFVVPVGTLGTSFTVKVTETNGKVWTKTANAPANIIARSQITVMPKQAVATKTPVVPSTVTVTAGCVSCTYSVGGTVTVPSGSHTCEYGLVYCPTSAGHLPTVADSKIVVNTEPINGSSPKTFTADLGVLENGVEYKVRAYAMIEGVTYSSESTVQTVTGGDVPQAMTWTDGKSPKKFTVADPTPENPNSGDETKVYFSQGNLQYIGSAATPYWKFADHQFDFLGNNGQGSTSETADRDLFGWGSTGNAPTGDSYYVNYQPWATSTSSVGSSYNSYGYGPSTNRPHPTGGVDERNLLVSNGSDWGANTIYAGTAPTTGWRTLTKAEWVYLINTRKDGSGKLLYGEGKVGSCTPGLIILPDDWSCPSGLTDVVRGTSSWSNVYSYPQWARMEAAGAVFLPAAGYRLGTSVNSVGSFGYYWSSSYISSDYAHYLYFRSGNVNPSCDGRRYNGFSVRVVSEN